MPTLEAGPQSATTLPIIPYQSLKNMDVPKVEYIVDQLIPEIGLTMFQGHPGSFKSWFAYYLAFCVAEGTPLLGRYTTKQAKVLLICPDDYLGVTKDRMASIGFPETTNVFVWNPVQELVINPAANIPSEAGDRYAQLLKYVEVENIGLVIIDTFRHMHEADENSSQDMRIIMQKLSELGNRRSVIILHHLNKAIGASTVVASRGSTSIPAALIAALDFKYDRNSGTVIIHPFKNKIGRCTDDIRTHINEITPGPSFFVIAEPDTHQTSIQEIEEAIRGFYEQNPEPGLTRSEFVKRFNADTRKTHSVNAIKTAFQSVIESGYLKWDGQTHQGNKRIYVKNVDVATGQSESVG